MLTFKVSVSPRVKVKYVKVKYMRYFDKTIFDTVPNLDLMNSVVLLHSLHTVVLQSFSCRSAIC